jgi:hypothetical protein
VFARCLLGCPGTTSQRPAQRGTNSRRTPHGTAQTGIESTYLIAEQWTLNPRVRGSSPWRRTRPDLGFLPNGSYPLQFALQLLRIRPKRPSDSVGGFGGQRVSGIGLEAGRGDLCVPEYALDHVHVGMLLAEQSSGRVAGVVEPRVLSDARLGEQGLLLLPIVVRVDGPPCRPAPDQVPVLPRLMARCALGVLVRAMLP